MLIDITGKAIIVIKDIDCSLDLTEHREKKKEEKEKKDGDEKDPKRPEEEEATTSKVTLSRIWSACGEERLIVFTTNYVDKLDPAFIRRGRMDKHIQLSYCCYEVAATVKAEEEASKKAEEEAKLKAEKEEEEKEISCNAKDEVKCNGTKDEVKGTSVAEVKENGVTP
ncbi:hypothetical protein L3X38_020328 [Prunus dulcis]|uniref:ATPase AAA-type core domain-containing protein n=1 Tax=Prunus dulcis TaxID=3755 RepID=A0AAD4WCV1_PRUDU|nr:hypothetical protein L3X38_020328 [Prunus dulcis]